MYEYEEHRKIKAFTPATSSQAFRRTFYLREHAVGCYLTMLASRIQMPTFVYALMNAQACVQINKHVFRSKASTSTRPWVGRSPCTLLDGEDRKQRGEAGCGCERGTLQMQISGSTTR
jgi:hypothetical protein